MEGSEDQDREVRAAGGGQPQPRAGGRPGRSGEGVDSVLRHLRELLQQPSGDRGEHQGGDPHDA